MDVPALTVDPNRLRAVANRVERSARTLETSREKFRFTGLDEEDLRGSAVAGVASPELVAACLDDVIADMTTWAAAARIVADRFERADDVTAQAVRRA